MVELLNPFGEKNGEMVTVDDVAKGDRDISCPECSDTLIPKKGNMRVHHFSHSAMGGAGCGEGALHRYCKEFLSSPKRLGKQIVLPGTKCRHHGGKAKVCSEIWPRMKILASMAEHPFPTRQRRADVAMKGQILLYSRPVGIEFPIAIEICVTNPKDADYISDLEHDNLAGLEIEITLDLLRERKGRRTWEEVIHSLLMSSTVNKRFLSYPACSREIEGEFTKLICQRQEVANEWANLKTPSDKRDWLDKWKS